MKSIILCHSDGARYLAFVAKDDFDTQSWANSRIGTFKFFQVVRVIEEYADESKAH